MAKKERPLSILLIDDKVDEMHEFIALASQHRIIIKKAVKSAETGLEELRSHPSKYDAVILDAKAFRKKDQARGTETFKSLRDCINGIKELERDNGRLIPHCVYTGHMDTMGESWEDDLKIFVKGRDQEALFDYLKTEVANVRESAIIKQYYDVFEVFDLELFDSKYKERLLFILMNYDSNNGIELENCLSHTRKILEGIYKTLSLKGRIDGKLIPNGRPNLEWCQRYITGLPIDEVEDVPPAIVPSHIGWSFKILKENASAAGAHDYESSIHNFSLKTMVFALMDVLLWFKNFAKENR